MSLTSRTLRDLLSHRLTRRAAAAAAVALAAGCADAPTAPVGASAPGAAPEFRVSGLGAAATAGVDALVLQRPTPLATTVQARAQIGPAGGTLSLPGTGLTLTVPAGAVSAPTAFSITAPAGRGVWYEFGPSGTRFAVPLVVTQELPEGLVGGPLGRLRLDAVYFADGTQNEARGSALAKEVLPLTVNAAGTQASFRVTHFSGYMVSTGRR